MPQGRPRSVRLWRLVLLAASVVALIALPAFAQRADKPDPMTTMNKAWSAFYQQKYQDAVKLTESLADWPESYIREQALHCMARPTGPPTRGRRKTAPGQFGSRWSGTTTATPLLASRRPAITPGGSC